VIVGAWEWENCPAPVSSVRWRSTAVSRPSITSISDDANALQQRDEEEEGGNKESSSGDESNDDQHRQRRGEDE